MCQNFGVNVNISVLYPEDGNINLLRNIGNYVPDYTMSLKRTI